MDLFVASFSNKDNFLYHNNNDGTFTKVLDVSPVTDKGPFSQCCNWCDYDNDGDLDLFVASDGPNFLYENQGGGEFIKINEGPVVLDSGSSVGGSWGDYDNDGYFDLFVTNDYGQNNCLYHNDGDGTFTKITSSVVVNDGVNSLGSSWGDFDNDGDIDLVVINSEQFGIYLYYNNGDGTFTKIISDEISTDIEGGWGTCTGDYDKDGDLDLFIAKPDYNSVLYKNEGNSNKWINVKCRGTVSNTTAIGARISVKAKVNNASYWQVREISGETGYSGQNSLNANFGLGDATIIDTLKIDWPSGISETYSNVGVNQFVIATENMGIKYSDSQDSIVPIPDTAFLYALIEEGVDTDGDSLISYGEAEAVISLDISGDYDQSPGRISNLIGIEAFINLDSLLCYYNDIDTLNISALSKLRYLDCGENPFTSIDLSGCSALEFFNCHGNQLYSLDISQNRSLIAISVGCSDIHEVCVWTLPFPPENVYFDAHYNGNICFETDCSGECGDDPTGENEWNQSGELIYPNPTNSLLNIETVTSGPHTINIFSLNGQLMLSKEMEGTTHHLDLSSFQKGVYFITIRTEDYLTTRKIVKL